MSTIPFSILRPKAKKIYRCIYCGESILVGEKHAKASGAWEGELQDWRMHNECLVEHDSHIDDNEGMIDPYASERPPPPSKEPMKTDL